MQAKLGERFSDNLFRRWADVNFYQSRTCECPLPPPTPESLVKDGTYLMLSSQNFLEG